MPKYRLSVKIWVPQDKIYDTEKEAYDDGRKLARKLGLRYSSEIKVEEISDEHN